MSAATGMTVWTSTQYVQLLTGRVDAGSWVFQNQTPRFSKFWLQNPREEAITKVFALNVSRLRKGASVIENGKFHPTIPNHADKWFRSTDPGGVL